MIPLHLLRRYRGFTLAELAIALTILALLIAAFLIPLRSQSEQARIRDTDQTLERIRDALIGFALAHGRLPCPADPLQAQGSTVVTPYGPRHAGEEMVVADSNATNVANKICDGTGLATSPRYASGVVPWVTLSVPQTDAWGHRFTYSVQASWADNLLNDCTGPMDPKTTPVGVASFCIDPAKSLADLKIFTRPQPGAVPQSVAEDLVAVVISHGPNGYLSIKPDGVQAGGTVANVWPAARDEDANGLAFVGGHADPEYRFMQRDEVKRDGACTTDSTLGGPACEFDDRLAYVSRHVLISRMVAAGRLP